MQSSPDGDDGSVVILVVLGHDEEVIATGAHSIYFLLLL